MTRPPWPRLALSLALLSLYLAPTWAQDPFAVTAPPKKVKNCTTTYVCKDGMILPTWEPQVGISNGDRFGKALVYFIFLVYFFLGVSIVSDVFMSSIEVITSKEREVKVKKPTGETFTITVRIWNETVSNLTLMALGSSAPEILLSIIEIIGNNFRAGDLGPNTIVGSAAFNLFMIIAICVWVVPSSEVRRQQHPHVFMVTATWSVFAYIWLYIIISVSTPRVVDIWEGVLTFAFFPLTVLTAWLADRRIFPGKAFARKIGLTRGSLGPRLSVVDGDIEMNAAGGFADDKTPEVVQFEKTRQEFMRVFRELRKSHPDTPIDQLQQMAEYEMVNKGPKSRAFYRVQATRKLVGGGNIVKKKLEKEHKKHEIEDVEEELHVKYTTQVSFDPGHYTVLENVGTFNVTVTRTGGPQDTTILVDYRTEDGTADAGSDYIEAKGTLTLHPGDQHATIPVTIMDDDVFEEDEHFYMHLENLRVQTKDGLIIDPTKLGGMPMAELSVPATATIMILDDDHAGVFEFEQPEMEVTESVGTLHLKVARRSGARGKVIIPYTIKEGTATNAVHFTTDLEGELTFENDDIEQFISIPIHDAQEYEKDEHFEIELKDPIWTKKLTDHHKLYQRMKRSAERKATLQASRNTLSSVGSGERRPSMQKIMSMMQKVNEFLQGGSDESEWPEDESDADRTSQKSGDNSASLGVPGGAMEAKALEEAQIAELGRPRLGEVPEIKIRIRESKEFKGIVDRMLNVSHTAVLGTSSWKEQFIEAVTVSAGDDDDDDEEGEEGDDGEKEEKVPSFGDYVMHFLTVPWKVFFAIIPPTDYFGGWGCFVCSILMIGLLTAFIGDLASHFGCTIGLKDAVTAISFVALGTSVPDTFASKVAAIQDKYADSSIGNVTGSNAVNVFLGIGIAWTMAAVYHAAVGTPGGFIVDPGTLAYSVVIFCTEAVACIGVITLRRIPAVGGELGGPLKFKIPTVIFMVSLWCIYIIMSALESYCIVEGF